MVQADFVVRRSEPTSGGFNRTISGADVRTGVRLKLPALGRSAKAENSAATKPAYVG